jgi:hypothetical protein
MTKLFAIRLKPNEDLQQSLKDFSIQQNIQVGFILTAIPTERFAIAENLFPTESFTPPYPLPVTMQFAVHPLELDELLHADLEPKRFFAAWKENVLHSQHLLAVQLLVVLCQSVQPTVSALTQLCFWLHILTVLLPH